jgi:hypothetical protein
MLDNERIVGRQLPPEAPQLQRIWFKHDRTKPPIPVPFLFGCRRLHNVTDRTDVARKLNTRPMHLEQIHGTGALASLNLFRLGAQPDATVKRAWDIMLPIWRRWAPPKERGGRWWSMKSSVGRRSRGRIGAPCRPPEL